MHETTPNNNKVISAWFHSFQLVMEIKTSEFDDLFLIEQRETMVSSFFGKGRQDNPD